MLPPSPPDPVPAFDLAQPLPWRPSPVFFQYALGVLMLGTLGFMVLVRLLTPEQNTRYIGMALASLIAAVAWLLVRSGRVADAVRFLVVGFWLAIGVIAWFNGGVSTPVVAAYPVLIMLVGWLFRLRTAVALAGLTVLTLAGLGAAQYAGVLPVAGATPAAMYGWMQLLLVALATVMIVFLVRSYREQLQELRDAGAAFARHSQALQASRARLDLAIGATQMVFWQYEFATDQFSYGDPNLPWLAAGDSHAAQTLSQWIERIHPDDRDAFRTRFDSALHTDGLSVGLEYRLALPSKGWMWVQSSGTVTKRDAQGKALLAGGGTVNISARKQAELALDETRTRLQDIFDRNPDVMMISRLADGCITDVNAAFVHMFGFSREEAIGHTSLGLALWVRPQEREAMAAPLLANGRCDNVESEFRSKDGSTRIASLTSVLTRLQGRTHIISTVRDVTERIRAEKSLANSEALLRTTLESIDEGILLVSKAGRVLGSNRRFMEMWRVPQAMMQTGEDQALLDHVLDQLCEPEQFASAVQYLYSCDDEARDTLAFKDRRVFARFTRVLPAGDEPGRIWCFRDITEQTKAQAALQQRERYQRALLDNFPFIVWLKDEDSKFLAVNAQFASSFGWPSAQSLVGKTDLDITSEDLALAYRADDRAVLDSGLPRSVEEELEVPDGRRWHETYKSPVTVDGRVIGTVGFARDISERKASEARINELNRDFVAFLEHTSDFIYFKDRDGRFRFCSQTLANITGHAHWTDMLGKRDLEVFPPETAHIYVDEDVPIFRDGKPLRNHIDPYINAAGERCWTSTNKWPVQDAHGVVVGLFGISHDITQERKAQEELQLAASVFSHAREAIMITATNGNIVDVNEAFTRITGYSRAEVLGQNPRIMSSGRQQRDFYATLWRDLANQGHWYGEVWNRRKDGEVFAVMQTISTVCDRQGQLLHYVSLFSDITAMKEQQSRLEHIAHFDALTGLPNRALLADRLQQGLAHAARRGQLLAVAYLDLDGFKAVNDAHGHNAGDQLLITLANRMKQTLREGDTLARLGGDEFVAVLVDLPDINACEPLLTRLLAAAAQPVAVDERTLQVSASLGVTFYPQPDPIDADQLLRQADQAMYQAKLAGKNRYHVFDAEQDRSVRGHHESLEHIRLALLQNEFVLYYQPKVNMRSGRVIGAEALIRWQHPQRGLLAPAVFLPAIEDHPLAVELGAWVIDTALTQMERWQLQGLNLPISVNVGARQLQQGDFVQRLQDMLAAHPRVPPSCLGLELLETSALEDIENVSHIIKTCQHMGVSFALDDFGTGYSSLTYLKRLPATLLKIDQSFVRNMLDDPEDLAILEGVIGLASAFSREVIAEGVETVAHGNLLLQLGCDQAQGYGIARPMPAQAFAPWVQDWTPPVDWARQALMSRDDLPLLFASVEHRAWLKALHAFCKHTQDETPELDPQQCHFGKWLRAAGHARYGTHNGFSAVEHAHSHVHAVAAELCQLRVNGQQKQALAQLEPLQQAGNELLQLLKGLARKQ